MARKPKAGHLGFYEWIDEAEFQPKGTEKMREDKFREAAMELAAFVGDGTPDELMEAYKEPIERFCADLRKALSVQHGMAPPMDTRRRVQRVADFLLAAGKLIEEDWKTGLVVMQYFEAADETYPKEFMHALVCCHKLFKAAEKGAQGEEAGRVLRTYYRRSTSNFANLQFLNQCRMLMTSAGERKVSLRKTDSPLLRFARPLYTYATGLRMADGSFDRQIRELKHIPVEIPATRGKARQ